jgi:uncharacterized protein
MDSAKTEILKVIVGSKAHGLADANSDTDYRSVYVLPTADILSLGYKYKGNDWTEGEVDNTAYELGHFLHLALQCNPSILEVMVAEPVMFNRAGIQLRDLFPYVWTPKRAYDAFTGYSLNQRKKLLDKKDNRANKWACAYVRTLHNLIDLLKTGTFSLKVEDRNRYVLLKQLRAGDFQVGRVIDIAEGLMEEAAGLLLTASNTQDVDKVNEFLISTRKEYWETPKPRHTEEELDILVGMIQKS